MKALVTGATGFIGRHLTERLATNGDWVRTLVRVGSDASGLQALGIEIVRGDVRDPAAVARAAAGCERVYHLAGKTGRHRMGFREFATVNMAGTENVARAAARAGVRRLVLASSTSVYGNAIQNRAIDEWTATRPDSPYGHSKLRAERIALDVQAAEGVPVVIARVTSTLGPGAGTWSPLFQSIAAGRFGMIGLGENHHHLADVADIVEGLVLCGVAAGAEGRVYILAGGEPAPLRVFIAMIGEEVGSPASARVVSAAPLRVYRQANRAAIALGWRSLPRYDRVEFFLGDRVFDLSRAREELGFVPRVGLREAIRRTTDWLRSQGVLPPVVGCPPGAGAK